MILKRFFFLLMFVFTTTLMAQNKATLRVNITSMENTKGKVLIGIYKSGKKYKKGEIPEIYKMEPIKDKRLLTTDFVLPVGEYFVMCFHDENSNMKIDKNIIGYPTEKYGISNNKFNAIGVPNFEASKIRVKEGVQTITINLR